MTCLIKKDYVNGYQLGVLRIPESLNSLLNNDTLSSEEQKIFQKLGCEKRKKEFLSVRHFISQYLGIQSALTYKESGQPVINQGLMNISISHTSDHIGILLSHHKQPGIDMEYLNNRILHIAPRFMTETELDHIGFDKRAHKLTLCWCVKESIYKIFSDTKPEFQSIEIKPFKLENEGSITAIIRNGKTHAEINCNYITLFDLNIVWACYA